MRYREKEVNRINTLDVYSLTSADLVYLTIRISTLMLMSVNDYAYQELHVRQKKS